MGLAEDELRKAALLSIRPQVPNTARGNLEASSDREDGEISDTGAASVAAGVSG